MFRTKLTRLFQIVLLSGILLSHIEIASAQSTGGGQAQLVEGRAIIVRQGKEMEIDSYPLDFKDQDLIQTFDKGKVHLTLKGGDVIFLAPKTEILFEEKLETKGLLKISNRTLKLKGRLLARIQRNPATEIQIRTPNAIVGVKGTEFVVEFLSKATNVGTLKGTVNLSSLTTGDSIDLEAGTMSSVSASGEVIPITEFSGELMRDFEFAGESMSEKDSAGKSDSLPSVQSQSKEECYLFVSGDIGEEKSVVDQIVRPLIGAFVSPLLKEVPVEGLSQSELNSSCYYDVSVNKVGETLNLSISGQRTSVPFNGLSESSRSFPENIRHSTLRIFHKELSKSKKEIICQEYGKFLVDECSLQPETIKERPETIVVPVSVMGDVSNIRRQILQNTLDDELKEHFRLIPQDRFEEVQQKVFEELEYEECTEDQCIMMIQEMLQVENMFHLQVIGEEGDTQLTLKWVNLDEKRVEEDFCEDCKTRELRKMIGGLVERLIGKK